MYKLVYFIIFFSCFIAVYFIPYCTFIKKYRKIERLQLEMTPEHFAVSKKGNPSIYHLLFVAYSIILSLLLISDVKESHHMIVTISMAFYIIKYLSWLKFIRWSLVYENGQFTLSRTFLRTSKFTANDIKAVVRPVDDILIEMKSGNIFSISSKAICFETLIDLLTYEHFLEEES